MIVEKKLSSEFCNDEYEKTNLTDNQKTAVQTVNLTNLELKDITEKLLKQFFIEYASESTNTLTMEILVLQTLKTEVNNIFLGNETKFDGLITEIANSETEDICIETIIENIFTEEKTTWYRILQLFAFGAGAAKRFKETNQDHRIAELSQVISSYITQNQESWFLKNGNWKGFLLYFRGYEWKFIIPNSVIYGLLGLGTALLYMFFIR